MASSKKNLSNYSESNIVTRKEYDYLRIGIAVSEWNQDVTSALLQGAVDTLQKYGFAESDYIIKWVPGSFELPLAAQYLINYAEVDAVICLGCVIQGETKHFDFVCLGVTEGIMRLNLDTEAPVSFGLLTTENQQQALDRSGGKHGNKGVEAAVAVLKMLKLKFGLIDEFDLGLFGQEDLGNL
jgi:6,7-dimethyl-8-ribityllumazine synthase